MGQHHPCLERHRVAGIHTAADPLSIAGIRIADSYRAGDTADNHPVPEVAAGNTLVTLLADSYRAGDTAGNHPVPEVAVAVPLALYRLRMEVVARWIAYS